MRSKISFFNKGLFFSNIKRFSWACILETVVMFFFYPFSLMMMHPDAAWLENVTDILERRQEYTAFCNLSICVYAVALAVLLFHYLHQPKMTTALHGLPVSRTELFFSAVLSGAVLLAVPIVLNVLLIFITKATMEIGAWVLASSVLRWAAYALLLSLVLFAFTAFVGMFVGNPAAHFIFTYILHFLPLAVFAGFMALCQMFLYGFDTSFDIPQWILELPMMTVMHDFTRPCGYYMLLFAILSVVFIVLALVAYKKRPLEQAGDVVVFSWVKPVFKYGVSVCFAVAGFLYIAGISGMETQDNLLGNTLLAALWGAVGFIIAQMLIMKSWRIFGAYRELIGACLAIALLFVLVQSDVTGFEKRTVIEEKVTSVTMSGFYDYAQSEITVSEPESIALATKLHQAFIDNRRELVEGDYPIYMRMEFKMEDGSVFRRAYNAPAQSILLEMYNQPEFKRAGYPMLYADVERIESIGIYTNDEKYYINDRQRVLEAMRADIDARRFGEDYFRKEALVGASIGENYEVAKAEPSAKYHLEFEMTEPAYVERNNVYVAAYRSYYNFDIREDEMPQTFALLEELMPTLVPEE
ncbi:MAG: hypothetical protein IJD83_04820 [Clostridia bacterium]|nr:hypothetical protein [Clostridia bacterium]